MQSTHVRNILSRYEGDSFSSNVEAFRKVVGVKSTWGI